MTAKKISQTIKPKKQIVYLETKKCDVRVCTAYDEITVQIFGNTQGLPIRLTYYDSDSKMQEIVKEV